MSDTSKHFVTIYFVQPFDWAGEDERFGFDVALRRLFCLAGSIVDVVGFSAQSFKCDELQWFPLESCPKMQQRGIPRINCVDCLDRTNLGMLAIGQEALKRQLILLGCIESKEPDSSFSKQALNKSNSNRLWSAELPSTILRQLSHLWGKVGDEIAIAYAGSPAMHRADISPEFEVLNQNSSLKCCTDLFNTKIWEQNQELVVFKRRDTRLTVADSEQLKGVLNVCLEEKSQLESPQCNHFSSSDQTSINEVKKSFMNCELFHQIQSVSRGTVDVHEYEWKAKKRSNLSIAVQRYIHNIFGDLDRQRALDLMIGKFRPRIGAPSIWEVELFPNDFQMNEVSYQL